MALERLDRAASHLFPEFSRARLQAWIKSGELTVDDEIWRPKDKVSGGEVLEIEATPEAGGFQPEDISLQVVFEDDAILVIDKPAGLVVHPGAGNPGGTVLNGLIFRDPALAVVPRAGIVHRLDKDTSGLMVVARTLASQNSLVQQLQAREVSRIYETVVYGEVPAAGMVDEPIGRHPVNRTKMAINRHGKEAVTHYRILAHYGPFTHLEVSLETGRTHQIRVHMQHLGFPLVGDPTYGANRRPIGRIPEPLQAAIESLGRQALHARRLTLKHPSTGETMTFESALPEDFAALLAALEAER